MVPREGTRKWVRTGSWRGERGHSLTIGGWWSNFDENIKAGT